MASGFDKAKRALRDFSRDFPTEEETRQFFSNLVSEADDRVIAITMASFLDDALAAAILKNFRKLNVDEAKSIFGPEMPLSTFSSKIKIAYAMGLCDRRQFKNMDAIRLIRNAFSHSKRPCDFSTPAIAEMCGHITPKIFRRVEPVKRSFSKSPKFVFVSEVILTIENLMKVQIWGADGIRALGADMK